MTTSNVKFTITNEAEQVPKPTAGVLFFEGVTKRGVINDPKTLINTPAMFRKMFGNIDIDSDFPMLCYRALDRGAILRINRIVGAGSAIAESASIGTGAASNATAEVTSILCKANTTGSLNNKWFQIFSANDTHGYYVWFNVAAGGVDPLIPGMTAVPVALDGDKTAAQVATAVLTALNGIVDTPFSAVDTLGNGYVVVTNSATGPCTNAANGTASPGFTFAILQGGYSGSPTTPLFKFIAKAAGADYNNVVVKITNASNQNPNYFNVGVSLTNDTKVTESYENLTIEGIPTVAESTYANTLNKQSDLITVSYVDCSGYVGPLRPANGTYTLTGGLDGAAPVLSDYVGDAATGNGFHAFDDYDDSYALSCPELSEDDLPGLSVAGEAYAANRADLAYYQHLDNTNTTADLLKAEKPALNSKYITFTAGGLENNHPLTGLSVGTSELADVLGNMAYIHQLTGKPWNAFFGPNFGVLNNTLGPINNFGSPAKFHDLDDLAQNRINMVVKKQGLTMLWDDYTSQVAPSPENFACLVNLEFYIKKSLRPTLEKFIGKPTDFTLLRDIYYKVQPFLQELIDGRACSAVMWEGDQYANSFEDLTVNTAADMQLGKVRIKLRIVTIAPLKEIAVDIILTKAGVSFE